jgi:hypothetical protein
MVLVADTDLVTGQGRMFPYFFTAFRMHNPRALLCPSGHAAKINARLVLTDGVSLMLTVLGVPCNSLKSDCWSSNAIK